MRTIVLMILAIMSFETNRGSAAEPRTLFPGIHTMDVPKIQQAINLSASVNTPDRLGVYPLIYAIKEGRADVVEMILQSGGNPNVWQRAIGDKGLSALEFALDTQNFKIVKLLQAYNVDVNAKIHGDRTLLMRAARMADEPRFFALKNLGADIHARDEDGCSVLIHAIQGKSFNIVRDLVLSGVDTYACDNDGNSPLDYAKRSRNQEMQTLISYVGAQPRRPAYLED